MGETKLTEIKQAVRELSDHDLANFRTWFAEFDAQEWDRKFEKDVTEGKLDKLAEKALKELREGKCRDL
ncbi:hypothetical protein WH8501_04760 [Crocosphaera watsonii WH 8501]|uniref:Uncharacterized protein n=5 Tax=Crocosphaera watsonii TaxID=263511 RepID=Q4C7W1_CROWT|nr:MULTISPECIES: hypothetical protein [Crocosphaera]EAM52510.1 conserved hypothetical protein [Crocosphaera watsonii WH 8501]EHJ14275.1 hypothetical protein CWATWH0003_1049 [Crocosphaera watsonii WH 0003]MCH2243458.1 hypothetical protein [Crocosphaera sp.]NQZ64109.1 hypothetical protein [Crocosphaera sp.]CCQ53183.1 hypothetical protein CWATWH8502_2156 [Crocosphaera watsonii WH 8502]